MSEPALNYTLIRIKASAESVNRHGTNKTLNISKTKTSHGHVNLISLFFQKIKVDNPPDGT